MRIWRMPKVNFVFICFSVLFFFCGSNNFLNFIFNCIWVLSFIFHASCIGLWLAYQKRFKDFLFVGLKAWRGMRFSFYVFFKIVFECMTIYLISFYACFSSSWMLSYPISIFCLLLLCPTHFPSFRNMM